MKKSMLTKLLGTAAAVMLSASLAQASIITTGNVEPVDPSTWDSSTEAYIGNTAEGTLTVDGYSNVASYRAFLGYEAGATGMVTVDGSGSMWLNSENVYVGRSGTGVLNITNGASVFNSSGGLIGYSAGSSGTVTVDGEGSMLTGDTLTVGLYGTGTLNITNGALVSNYSGRIGHKSGGSGTVTVDGEGSMWANSSGLTLGRSGTGTLSISDGGAVTASSVSVNSLSTLTIDLGYGSSLTIDSGSGTITNSGTLRLVAGAGAASGTYTPVSYGTLSGNDAQALGGVWDAENHTVTVYDAATASAGEEKTIDLFATQRILITDEATGQRVGASLMATPESTDLTFTANVMDSSNLSLLESSLDPGEDILAGWDFSVSGSGYAEGDPVYLSLAIGSGYDLSDLAVWLFDGSSWSEYLASDLSYDDVYASFTATDLCGYAVTGTASVPIPGAVWLLGSGLLGLVGIRRRQE